MKGLQAAKVVVLDDDEDEAVYVLNALAVMGIAAAFYNPTKGQETFPAEPLSGVRLAILDMDLVGAGTDDKSKISALIGAIRRILSVSNGPYSVLVWTKHPDLQEAFERALFATPDAPKPISVQAIAKAEVGVGGKFNPTLLHSRIAQCLDSSVPLAILQSWEQLSLTAASEVLRALSALVQTGETEPERWRDTWTKDSLSLMKALAKAEGGKALGPESYLSTLFAALNPIFVDRFEASTRRFAPQPALAEAIFSATGDISSDRIAKLNSMLHLSYDHLDKMSAGNTYLVAALAPLPFTTPTADAVLSDLLNEAPPAETLEALRLATHFVAIEISPQCDHAQGKLRSHNFVTGLLVPAELRPKYKKPKAELSYIWESAPIYMEDGIPPGVYSLLLSARHHAVTDVAAFQGKEAFVRLRSQILSQVQFCMASYSSRPAVTVVAQS